VANDEPTVERSPNRTVLDTPTPAVLPLPPNRPPSSPPDDLVRAETLMPSAFVGPVIAYVRARGGDADGLIQRYELPSSVERDPVTVVPLGRLHALLDAAEHASDDPAMGVHVAERTEGGALALVALACSGVRDLRAALERYVHYVGTLNDELAVSVESVESGERKASGALLRKRVRGSALGLGRHGNEHWVAAVLRAARHVTGAPCIPERVFLAHPGGPLHPEVVRLFGTTRVEQGAGFNGIEVSEGMLATPLRPSPSKLSSLLERYATFVAAEGPRESALDDRIRDVLRRRLPDGAPSIGIVARALGTSARTLQRRLSDEGLSFQGIIDALRADLARAYVRTGRLSVGEVAMRLGYAQTSAFVRAFRRWTGTTPKQLRGGEPPCE
jgi:AraC-like DNA-binding protein